MAAVTIYSDFGAQKKLSQPLFPLFPHLFAMKCWDQMPWSLFSECWVLSQLFHFPLSLSSRGSLVLLCFLAILSCPKDNFMNICESTSWTVKHRNEWLLPNIAEGHKTCPESTWGMFKEISHIFKSRFQHYLNLVSDKNFIHNDCNELIHICCSFQMEV